MDAEREIRKLLKEFVKVQDNLILTDRLFIAVSVLNWALLSTKEKHVLEHYLNLVKDHLKGDITLYWQEGVVKIKRGTR